MGNEAEQTSRGSVMISRRVSQLIFSIVNSFSVGSLSEPQLERGSTTHCYEAEAASSPGQAYLALMPGATTD